MWLDGGAARDGLLLVESLILPRLHRGRGFNLQALPLSHFKWA